MTNPIEQLLLAGATGPRFPANSRYHAVATREWTGPDGRDRARGSDAGVTRGAWMH
jgi:hypothetical protein